jgi:nucleotide-binding universal stress UspA family protein
MKPAARMFNHMLVPVDGSDSSLKAARFAVRLAFCEECDVYGVHVVDEEAADDFAHYTDRPVEAILERMKRTGEEYLEDVRKIAEEEGVKFSGEVLVGIPHRVILEQAAARKIDFIVMGTVGRRGPRRVLLGSVTERVIEHSGVPVLVVK